MPKNNKTRPKTNGENGRATNGRFTNGNPGGPGGDPYAAYITTLRAALCAAVTKEDIAAIAMAQIKKARRGNTYAAHFIFDRILGKSVQPITGDNGGPVEITVNVAPPNNK